ncbi:U3 small nucleolar ribonucleoprotein complex, subunit Mpp10 [Powellomyces hirtus]|nr:U3 small nucleolar ribonucleoprotein complex, subunit Mpp10 [Powellomyces hirtus]
MTVSGTATAPSPFHQQLEEVLGGASLDSLLSRPDAFLRPNAALSDSFLKITQSLYEVAKHSEPFPKEFSPLEALLVDGFDAEQVWEQLQLQNQPMVGYLAEKVDHVLDDDKEKEEMRAGSDDAMDMDGEDGMELDEMSDDEGSDEEDEVMDVDQEDEESEAEPVADGADEEDEWDEGLGEASGNAASDAEEDAETGILGSTDAPTQRSEVDDDFFSLEEMERFADFGESRDLKKAERPIDAGSDDEEEDEYTFGDAIMNGEGLDMDDDNDDDNANEILYEDFFGPREHHPERHEGFSERPRNVRSFGKKQNREFDRGHNDGDDPIDAPLWGQKKTEDKEADLPSADEEEEMDLDGGINPDRVANLLDDDDNNEMDQGGEQLSRFEKQQQRLASQISQLENEALGEKSWTLKGEAGTKARPMNSLLEEDLDYEHAAKPVPVITEEITATLEDLIKQRIKDGLFDDVVRKAPPRDRKYDPNRKAEINDTKSTKGLAEVLEDDYLRRTTPGGKATTEKDEAVAKQQAEIDSLYDTLCRDLDALSNWHFTPAGVSTADLEIVALPNIPALEMEEVTPSHVAQSTLAAPSDIYTAAGNGSTRAALKSESELTANDKKRLRDASRKSAGRVKKSKQDLRDAVAAARPRTAADGQTDDTGKPRVSKESALKQLMGQKNVTIVADARMKKGMSNVRENNKKSSIAGKNNMRATLVEKGGKIGDSKKVEKSQNLRL